MIGFQSTASHWIRISGGAPGCNDRRWSSFLHFLEEQDYRVSTAYHFIRRGGVKEEGVILFDSGGRRKNLISYDSTGHFCFVFPSSIEKHGTSRSSRRSSLSFILPRFDSDLPVLNYRAQRDREFHIKKKKRRSKLEDSPLARASSLLFSLALKRHWLFFFLSVVGLCDLPDTYTSPNSPTDVSSVLTEIFWLHRVWFRSDFLFFCVFFFLFFWSHPNM